MSQPKIDQRYPYTYAADFIRILAGYGKDGTKISRADASKIRQGISAALKLDDEELAKKLADYYVANEDSLSEDAAKEIAYWLSPDRKEGSEL